jgi:hypothetical protein
MKPTMTDEQREARRAYHRAYYVATKPYQQARQRKRRQQISDEEKARKQEYNATYYAANKAKIAADNKTWRQKNPEKVKADRARYKSNNRAKVRAAAKAYYHATKETRKPQRLEHTRRRNAMRPALVRAAREAIVGPKPETCQACGGTDGGIVFDHCHARQHPRGWLCDRCNVALGCLRDSPDRLRKLLAYLKRSERYQYIRLTGWAKAGL